MLMPREHGQAPPAASAPERRGMSVRSPGQATLILVKALAVAGVLTLAGLLARGERHALSSPPPAMRLDPGSLKVGGGPGTPFTVDVVIEGVADLGAFEFQIQFDTEFVKLSDIRAGPFLGSTERLVACARRTVNFNIEEFGCNTEGLLPPGPSGSGIVAYVDFVLQGRSFGETSLLLQDCGAADVLGMAIFNNVCKNTKLTVNPPTPTPERNPRMIKQPALQSLFLTGQGVKLPPTTCLAGENAASFEERLNMPLPDVPDPKDPTQDQELGAFEFELRYDSKLVCVELAPGPAASGMICFVQDSVTAPALEGIARLGCVTQSKDAFPDTNTAAGRHLANVIVRPEPELYSQIRPNQENGIVIQLLNQGCELADLQGHPIKLTSCDDADLTVRYLEGDVQPDCQVDVFDTQATAFRWGVQLGSLVYNERFDLEPSGAVAGDGDIDVKDLQFVYGRFGSTCTEPHPPQPPVNPKALGTPTPAATPTVTPTASATPTKPRINKSPSQHELLLSSPPASQQCADSADAVSFDVLIKDPITSPDPKTPSQLQVLGAFEFKTFFDPAFVCIEITPGQIPQGEMSCFSEQGSNFVRFGCATLTKLNPPQPQPPGVFAVVTVRPQPAVYSLIGPGEQLVTQLFNDFCQLADLQGHDIKIAECADATVVIRYP